MNRTEEIENKMLLLGLSGMAYSDEWNKLALEKQKIKEMKNEIYKRRKEKNERIS